jgi:hypothetical protein
LKTRNLILIEWNFDNRSLAAHFEMLAVKGMITRSNLIIESIAVTALQPTGENGPLRKSFPQKKRSHSLDQIEMIVFGSYQEDLLTSIHATKSRPHQGHSS